MLEQVYDSLKQTSFKDIYVSLLGSRDKFCVNEYVKPFKGKVKGEICKQKVSKGLCGSYKCTKLESA